MATLTTSWQLLASAHLGYSYGDLYVRLYGRYSEQDIANNRSYVYFQSRAYFGPKNYIKDNQGTGSVTGPSGSKSGSCTYITGGSEVTIATSEGWVSHASDGKKTVSGSAYLKFPNWGWSATATANADLPAIPRQAKILTAPNFNDEENPTITYSNPAGTAATSLKACISWTGADDIAYRDISKTGSSYTFELTEEERVKLRKATLSGNSRSVRFYVTTWFGSTPYASTLDRTFTVINCNPVLSPRVIDIGTHSTQLTGDNNKIIKGYSIVNAEIGAYSQKEASILFESITCGNTTIHASTAVFEPAESGTFIFKATDDRGNTTTQPVEKEVIDYTKLTCNLISGNPTVDGNLQFNITGKYFDGSFGAVNNTLKVEYRFKITTAGEWSSWLSGSISTDNINASISDPIISNGIYSATVNVTGLDYKTTYVFQARAADEVYTGYIATAERAVRALPIFDWSDEDFNFNVPVTIDGKQVYPSGSIERIARAYTQEADISYESNSYIKLFRETSPTDLYNQDIATFNDNGLITINKDMLALVNIHILSGNPNNRSYIMLWNYITNWKQTECVQYGAFTTSQITTILPLSKGDVLGIRTVEPININTSGLAGSYIEIIEM